jgi:hypothetical protein
MKKIQENFAGGIAPPFRAKFSVQESRSFLTRKLIFFSFLVPKDRGSSEARKAAWL